MERTARPWLRKAKQQYVATGQRARLFSHFYYAAKTWTRRRRVILKAEHLPKGSNARFVVTSFRTVSAEELYETYCARGQCENYIKDLKLVGQFEAYVCDTCGYTQFWAHSFERLAAGRGERHPLHRHHAAAGAVPVEVVVHRPMSGNRCRSPIAGSDHPPSRPVTVDGAGP